MVDTVGQPPGNSGPVVETGGHLGPQLGCKEAQQASPWEPFGGQIGAIMASRDAKIYPAEARERANPSVSVGTLSVSEDCHVKVILVALDQSVPRDTRGNAESENEVRNVKVILEYSQMRSVRSK